MFPFPFVFYACFGTRFFVSAGKKRGKGKQMVKNRFGAPTVATFVLVMKRMFFVLLFFVMALACTEAMAQCSICTRTAAQLGEKPARGLNAGILYLAATPMLLVGVIAFRWWRRNGRAEA